MIIKFKFDDEAKAAQKASEEFAAKMVTEVSAETQKAINAVITKAIRDGIPPYDAARLVESLIGLTTSQSMAAMKYREELIDNGLTLDKVDAKVNEYADQLLEARAEMIARTEIMDALNTGYEESLLQAQEEGFLSDNATKEVILTDDACEEICVPIAEQGPVPIGDDFSEDGPPFHPHCRCTIGISTP